MKDERQRKQTLTRIGEAANLGPVEEEQKRQTYQHRPCDDDFPFARGEQKNVSCGELQNGRFRWTSTAGAGRSKRMFGVERMCKQEALTFWVPSHEDTLDAGGSGGKTASGMLLNDHTFKKAQQFKKRTDSNGRDKRSPNETKGRRRRDNVTDETLNSGADIAMEGHCWELSPRPHDAAALKGMEPHEEDEHRQNNQREQSGINYTWKRRSRRNATPHTDRRPKCWR